jgi:hypothetical protein
MSSLPSTSYSSPSEGNLGNISKTISIDISVKPGITKHIQIGADFSPEEIECYTALFKEFCDIFSWSYEEIPGIDPWIVVHEIKTYPEPIPFRQ